MVDVSDIAGKIVETGKSELAEFGKTAKRQVLGGKATETENDSNKELKRKSLRRQRLLAAQVSQVRAQIAAEAQKTQIEGADTPPQLEIKRPPQLARIGLTQQVASKRAETGTGRRGE